MTSPSLLLRSLLVVGLLAAFPPAVPRASAQPADTFLEQRVVEALAADGVVLSRLGVTLDVEQIGGKALVSLIEPATGRAAASTKVDTLPTDPDAAVASVALVVRSLVDQVIATDPARVAPPAEPPPPPAARDERAAHARELAEMRYQREAIRFGADLVVSGTNGQVSSSRQWVAMRGASDQRLAPRELYELLGRPDLAARYQSRRNTGTGLVVVGAVMIGAGFGYSGYVVATERDCDIGSSDFGACLDETGDRFKRAVAINIGMVAAGIGVAGLGVYYRGRAHPISENEAKALAESYNEALRRDLGLPTLGRTLRPRVQELRWTPVLDPSTRSGGLALGGRF